jgi:mycoredoxin-dependent peroxiredoxin
MSLTIGSAAPDFTLKNQHGEDVALASFKGKKNVVVLFIPFSFTGICTGELCDSMFTQKVFAEQEGYKFSVLSDFWPHGAVAKAYGIFDEARGCAIRGTFIVDKQGILRWQVVNGIGDARNIADYKAALAAL